MSRGAEATITRDRRHWSSEPDSKKMDSELLQMLLRKKKKRKHEKSGCTFCWISNTLPSRKFYVNNLDVEHFGKKLTFG